MANRFELVDQVADYLSVGSLFLDDLVIIRLLQPGPLSPSALAERSGFSPSKISRMIRRLVSLDLIEESIDSTDLRRSRVSLASRSANIIHELTRKFSEEGLDQAMRNYMGLRGALPDYPLSQRRILFALATSPSPVRIGQLAALCGLSQSNTSMAVASLRTKGLITTSRGVGESSTDDGGYRAVYAALSHEGRAVCSNLME